MATILKKDVIRESEVSIDDKPLVVTLSAEQSIILKTKGRKTKEYQINILDLYNMLSGENPNQNVTTVIDRGMNQALQELQDHSAFEDIDYGVKVEIHRLIKKIRNNAR